MTPIYFTLFFYPEGGHHDAGEYETDSLQVIEFDGLTEEDDSENT
jgi:hypothetical protein